MILQTVIDPMEVMRREGNTDFPSYEYLHRDGCILQCIRREDGIYLDRIISTNPKDYLNPSYRIGKML